MVSQKVAKFMKINFLHTLFISLSFFISNGCANRVAPNGGLKDATPPRVSESKPANKTLNFKGNGIVLSFDEFVVLQNPEQQVIVSPYMPQLPEFKIKGKSIEINFKEPLKNNTTYSINFGSSLKDLSEGNPLSNYSFTFSTGAALDTQQIAGKVLLADTNTPTEALVMLYEANAPDSAFRTRPPLYMARSDKEGNFTIRSLPLGSYRLYALKDKNGNFFYDQANEDIAFLPQTVNSQTVAADTTNKTTLPILRLFNEQLGAAILTDRSNREYGRIQLVYGRGIDSLQLTVLSNKISMSQVLPETTPDRDSIWLWYRNISPDEALKFALSGSKGLADTIEFVRTSPRKTLEALSFLSSINVGRSSSSIDPDLTAWIQFNHPISNWKPEKIKLLANDKPITTPNLITQSSSYPRRFVINNTLKPDIKYQLLIPDSTFLDYQGQYNVEIDLPFTTYPQQRYGTLRIKLLGNNGVKSYLYQLYRVQGDVLTKSGSLKGNETTIEYIKPELYNLVIIEDANNNGKWDVGNLNEKRQPERIFTPKKQTQIKALWDTETEVQCE
jgi:hypothetical protein